MICASGDMGMPTQQIGTKFSIQANIVKLVSCCVPLRVQYKHMHMTYDIR
jgi:hypothetical protein